MEDTHYAMKVNKISPATAGQRKKMKILIKGRSGGKLEDPELIKIKTFY